VDGGCGSGRRQPFAGATPIRTEVFVSPTDAAACTRRSGRQEGDRSVETAQRVGAASFGGKRQVPGREDVPAGAAEGIGVKVDHNTDETTFPGTRRHGC
jgi:hypothetical protein